MGSSLQPHMMASPLLFLPLFVFSLVSGAATPAPEAQYGQSYRTVYKEQCSPSYEQKCETVYQDLCITVNEQQCRTGSEQQCVDLEQTQCRDSTETVNIETESVECSSQPVQVEGVECSSGSQRVCSTVSRHNALQLL